MSVLILPQCPTDCSGSLPDVFFDECAPTIHYGEVSKIYLAKANAASFANVDLIGEWTARLSDTADTADSIRTLIVIGELPEPEQSEISISGDRTVVGFKQFNLPFEVDETNDINYNVLLTLECNLKFKMWYETADGVLYGGNDGIEATLRMNNVIPRERTEVAKFMGTAKWKSQSSPLRTASPMV